MPPNANPGLDSRCVDAFMELKLGKSNYKYIIFTFTNNTSSPPRINIEGDPHTAKPGASDRTTWEDVIDILKAAKLPDKSGAMIPGPRYLVFDFDYELKGGEGKRRKIALIGYCPPETIQYWKVVHSSSLGLVKTTLNVPDAIQVTQEADLEYDEILPKVDHRADLGSGA